MGSTVTFRSLAPAVRHFPKLTAELELRDDVLVVKATGERLQRSAMIGGMRHTLQAQVAGDRIIFTGGRSGQHSIAIESEISPLARVLAHWEGYCESNGFTIKEGSLVRFEASGVMRRARVLTTPKKGSKTIHVGSFFYKHGGESQPRRVPRHKVELIIEGGSK